MLVHSYQIQLSNISRELRNFFKRNKWNSIEFWDYPSYDKWTLYDIVDKEIKKFDLIPIFPCKSSWELNKKKECNEIIIKKIKKMFSFSIRGLEHHFPIVNNLQSIKLTYSKGGSWLKVFRHFNLLCARASRAIVNHTSIREYCLRFFLQEEFKCPCG